MAYCWYAIWSYQMALVPSSTRELPSPSVAQVLHSFRKLSIWRREQWIRVRAGALIWVFQFNRSSYGSQMGKNSWGQLVNLVGMVLRWFWKCRDNSSWGKRISFQARKYNSWWEMPEVYMLAPICIIELVELKIQNRAWHVSLLVSLCLATTSLPYGCWLMY